MLSIVDLVFVGIFPFGVATIFNSSSPLLSLAATAASTPPASPASTTTPRSYSILSDATPTTGASSAHGTLTSRRGAIPGRGNSVRLGHHPVHRDRRSICASLETGEGILPQGRELLL